MTKPPKHTRSLFSQTRSCLTFLFFRMFTRRRLRMSDFDSNSPASSGKVEQPPSNSLSNDIPSLHGSSTSGDHSPNPSAVRWYVPSLILGLWLVGVIAAVGHHLLLHFLDGRNVEEFSQFWIKNASNAFGTVVQFLFATSIAYSLSQAVSGCRKFDYMEWC